MLAGLLIEAERRRPGALDLRLRDLRPGHPDADVSEEGRALVSGRLLADICRSLPNKPVDMVIDGPKVSLTCGSARFSLQTMPVEDYPTLPQMPEATGTVPSDVFSAAVAQAVTAAGRDDMLPVLTGVRVEIDGDDRAARHRPFPALPARAAWDPAPRRVRCRAGAGEGARRHRQGADRRQRGHARAGRGRCRRGHDRFRGLGRRRRPAYDDPAARRRVPQGALACSRAST